MKTSHQIAILAAVGVGAYLLLRGGAAGGIMRPANATYPNGLIQPQPQPGTAQYAAWLAAQQQAQLDNAKISALYGLGGVVRSWFTAPSTGSAGNMNGQIRPSTDYGLGQPDSYAVNTPFNPSYTIAEPYDDGIGTQNLTSSDRAALYGNDGYGFYTQ